MKYCHHPTGRHNKKRANEREIYALWFSCVGCSNATTHHPPLTHSLTRSPPPYEKNINNFKARFSSRKICAYEKREREHCTHNDDGGGVHVVVIFLTVIVLFLVVFLSLSLFTRIVFLDFRSFWNFPPELNKMENFSKNKMLECHNNLASKEK